MTLVQNLQTCYFKPHSKTLLKIIILCNVSVVFADSNPPTECRLSINNNALYTNNRYVTLEIYGIDADPMQVWISNDGENGTVVDFAYGKTISITDANYTVGVALDGTNSTTTTNSDNILRIENWPLSSVNGTKTVYAVFRDSYGNKTSVNGLNTITITYDLNGGSGTQPASVTTVKNLSIYMPSFLSTAFNQSFSGWSASPTATLPSYYSNSLIAFNDNTTVYAIYKTVSAGDYIYYPVDNSRSYSALNSMTGVGTQTFNMSSKFSSSPALFRVLSANSTSIVLCPNSTSQVFSIHFYEINAYNNYSNVLASMCALYGSNYSASTANITVSQMTAHKTTPELSSFFANYFWLASGWDKPGDAPRARIGNSSGEDSAWINSNTGNGKTYMVCPAITLKTTVRFLGSGTSSNPYTITIP